MYVWKMMRPVAPKDKRLRFALQIHTHLVLLTVALRWENIETAKEISWMPLFGDALTVLVGKCYNIKHVKRWT